MFLKEKDGEGVVRGH